MSGGFYKRRRGILEHIEAGTIDLLESGIHDFLCLKANLVIGSDCSIPVGFVFTSAPAIRAHCKRVSERTIQRILEHLEVIGWIKTFRTRNQRGNYLTLICRASVHDLSGNEYRINGDATTDWRNPKYEPVGHLSPETSNVVRKLTGLREVRVEKRDKRQERAAKTAPLVDSRRQPFIEFAYKSFELHFGQKPSWQPKDWKQLKNLLAATSASLDELQARWRHFLASTEEFTLKKGGSLAHFCTNFDAFINGPLVAPAKGTGHGKLTGDDLTRANLKAAGYAVN